MRARADSAEWFAAAVSVLRPVGVRAGLGGPGGEGGAARASFTGRAALAALALGASAHGLSDPGEAREAIVALAAAPWRRRARAVLRVCRAEARPRRATGAAVLAVLSGVPSLASVEVEA